MLSLVKVEPAVKCEGASCPRPHLSRNATNHVYLHGHSYLRLCLDCVMQHAEMWEQNGGSPCRDELHYESGRLIRKQAEQRAAA